MKVGRLLKYESREVCTTRLHEESFASYLAISISAKYLAQTVGGDFIILVEWLVLNGNGSASNRFRAFLLELFCPPYTIRRNLFVSQRIEETEDENRFWNASIRRKELFDPRQMNHEFRQNFLRIFLAEEEFTCTRAKFRDAWFVWPDRLYLQWQTKYFIAKQI